MLLDFPNDVRRNGHVDHDAVGAAVFRFYSKPHGAGAGGDAAADPYEDGNVGHADDGVGDAGLRRKRVDGDDGVGVDVFDDGHVRGKYQRLDASTEDADTAAFIYAQGNAQRVAAQCSVVFRHVFFHKNSSLFPFEQCFVSIVYHTFRKKENEGTVKI